MPPLGRGRPSRGVLSFEDATVPLPERVVLDTSFVFESLVTSQKLHGKCQAYLVRLAEAGSAIFFNRLLEIELAETAFRYAFDERHGKGAWRKLRNDGRSRPRAGRVMNDVLDAWEDVLTYVPHRRIGVDDVADRVAEIMELHGLGSYDAVHAATAIDSGVRRLVAIDAGFGNVPEADLTLYIDRSRVASCRGRRR